MSRPDRQVVLGQGAEAVRHPVDRDPNPMHGAYEYERATEEQAMFEPVARSHAFEPTVAFAHEVDAIGMRTDPKRHDLRSDYRQQRPGDQRMDVPCAAEEPDVGDARSALIKAPRIAISSARQDEQMVGRMHQQEPQMPPTVAETRELGLAAARW